jgi:tetratricopeptide (TPR) repeat protein
MLLVWMCARNSFLKPAYGISIERQIKLLFESLPALIQYAGKIVFPVNLSVLPVIKDTTFIYGGAAIAIILLALALSIYKRPERIYFGLFWFLVFLLPSFCVPNNYFHEHRLYLPIIGFMIMVSGIGVQLNARASRLAGLLLIIALSALTFRHSGNYKDRYAYWANAVKTSPHSSLAHQGAGLNYLYDGKMDESEKELKESAMFDGRNANTHIRLGMVFWSKKMYAESEEEFRLAISLDPSLDLGYAAYAGFCYSTKREKEAEMLWKKAIELNPENIDVYKHLAVLCFRDNRPEESAQYCSLLRKKWGIDFAPVDNAEYSGNANEAELVK